MYDYLTKIDLNRLVDESEAGRWLNVHKPVADKAEDGYVVFGMNDVFLDVCEASYQQLGWGTFAFCIGFFPAIYFACGFSTLLSLSKLIWVPMLLCLGAMAFSVWGLLRDCFDYRHKTVRFNRKNRMVYAFRHNGPGGVVAVPWDKAFFFAERQRSVGIFGGAPTVMRCFVLGEDDKTIVDTFSFGLRTVNGSDEDTELGKQILDEVLANFEFIRRFMEEGPKHLPPVERYMPQGPSLKASLSIRFDGFDVVSRRNPLTWIVGMIVAGPLFLLSCFHYVAQLTSREPVWPEDVVRASQPSEPSSTIAV
jgi:hypothetical protein